MVDTLHCHLQIHPPSGSIILVMLHFMQKATPQQLLSGIIIFFTCFPSVGIELEKKAFSFFGPSTCNIIQQDL